MTLEQAEIHLDLFLIKHPEYMDFQKELKASLDALPEAMRLPYIFEMMLDSQDELKAKLEDTCTHLNILKTKITTLTSQTLPLK